MREGSYEAAQRDPQLKQVMVAIYRAEDLLDREVRAMGIAGLTPSQTIAALHRGESLGLIEKITVSSGSNGKGRFDLWTLINNGTAIVKEWLKPEESE